MVHICLFGGVSAATDGGEPLAVGSTKSQTVLAVLALSAGSVVPVTRLVDLVWAEQPPPAAQKALQWHVARLRGTLGSEAIVRVGAAYQLAVAPDAVDVTRFQRHLAAGDVGAALREWTGVPLAGLTAPGLTATVDGLTEQWLTAVEVDIERRLETDPQEVIGQLTELRARYPFREGLSALLMTALYRVGRQADALATFQRTRRDLDEELGVAPGPRLRELQRLVLDHDERLRSPRPATAQGSLRPTGTVTFGFVEVAGSSRLWDTHQHRAAAAMARLDAIVRSVTESHDGYLFTSGAESFGVAFQRAAAAAAWAADLQAAVGDEPWPGGVGLRVRVGLHTGETDEEATGYFGTTVLLAARIAAAAHGGQVLASGVTAGVLERTDLRDLGTVRLDDIAAAQRILQLDDGEHPPLRTEDSRWGNLPRRMGRLIGRDEDVSTVADALAQSPVLTLVGTGGIGKTRLALAAARVVAGHRGCGAWVVELAEIAVPDDVPRAVADVLGVVEHQGRTLTQSIVTVLRSRPAVLVMDNCEHVIAGAATLIQTVAEGCPTVQVIATSREGLGIRDEHRYTVEPLEPAGAGAELFSERARAVDRHFDPQVHRPDIEEICRRLDGIPLAIELAAARTSSLAPSDIVARLDDPLRLLTGGHRTAAERHRTLRATMQWSYDLLTPQEQALLERLSVFAGPFDLAAAEAVAAEEASAATVADLLGGLVERSLLVVESGPFHRRFRLLETVRQFAAEYLRAHGHTDRVAAGHARWCTDEIARIHRLLTGPGEIEGVARLGELWPNLRCAVDSVCATGNWESAQALAGPIATEIALRGRHEIGDWSERILALMPPEEVERRAFWLLWAAERYTQNGDEAACVRLVQQHGEPDHPLARYARAYLTKDGAALRQCLPEAASRLRQQDEAYLAAFLDLMSAGTLLGIGCFTEVDDSVSALADRYRASGPPTLLHMALQTLGYSASFQGRSDAAGQFFDESTRVAIPDRTLSANKPIEARAAFRRGQRTQAFGILRAYIDELLETDNVVAASVVGIEFINMVVAVGRFAEGARVLRYLEEINEFGAFAARTMVAEAVAVMAEAGHPADSRSAPDLDDRQALEYMRAVLDELT